LLAGIVVKISRVVFKQSSIQQPVIKGFLLFILTRDMNSADRTSGKLLQKRIKQLSRGKSLKSKDTATCTLNFVKAVIYLFFLKQFGLLMQKFSFGVLK
jgi:hypothetical protein